MESWMPEGSEISGYTEVQMLYRGTLPCRGIHPTAQGKREDGLLRNQKGGAKGHRKPLTDVEATRERRNWGARGGKSLPKEDRATRQNYCGRRRAYKSFQTVHDERPLYKIGRKGPARGERAAPTCRQSTVGLSPKKRVFSRGAGSGPSLTKEGFLEQGSAGQTEEEGKGWKKGAAGGESDMCELGKRTNGN